MTMINVFEYINKDYFKLSEEQQDAITKYISSLFAEKLDNLDDYMAQKRFRDAIKMLNALGYFPTFEYPGHRCECYFPSETDCEMWYDYFMDLREDG